MVAVAFGPVALTDMSRQTFENDVMPAELREMFRVGFTTDPETLLRQTMSLFKAISAGGADALSGSYVGAVKGPLQTPSDLAGMVPTDAGRRAVLARAQCPS